MLMSLTAAGLFLALEVTLAAEQYKPALGATPAASTSRPTEFIEQEILGFRLWMILAFVFTGISIIIVVLCCIFDCRIPRTKQEIDADFERKQLAKKFTSEMSKIPPGQQFRVLRAARQTGPVNMQNSGLYSGGAPTAAAGGGGAGGGGDPQPGPSSREHLPLTQQPKLLMKSSTLNQLQRPLRYYLDLQAEGAQRMRPGQSATAKTLASMSQQHNTQV